MHFGAMAIFAAIVMGLTNSPLITLFICLFFSVGKEIFDCIKPNATGFSEGDLLADIAGMGLGLLLGALF